MKIDQWALNAYLTGIAISAILIVMVVAYTEKSSNMITIIAVGILGLFVLSLLLNSKRRKKARR